MNTISFICPNCKKKSAASSVSGSYSCSNCGVKLKKQKIIDKYNGVNIWEETVEKYLSTINNGHCSRSNNKEHLSRTDGSKIVNEKQQAIPVNEVVPPSLDVLELDDPEIELDEHEIIANDFKDMKRNNKSFVSKIISFVFGCLCSIVLIIITLILVVWIFSK